MSDTPMDPLAQPDEPARDDDDMTEGPADGGADVGSHDTGADGGADTEGPADGGADVGGQDTGADGGAGSDR